jgi:hypothetical protein
MKNTLNQKENKELKEWKARFQAARDAYADQRNEMKKFSE